MFPPFTYLSYTTILISYAFASYLLLKFPNLLWKKRRYQNELLNEAIDGKRVLHISHRGGTRERLENTIEAFKNACKIGSDILELDVHLTKDHKVVVCHDTILDRLCGVNVCVNDLNYADLPPFSENVFMHFSNNQFYQTKNAQKPYFPLLEELFQEFPDKTMNIELKNANETLIEKTLELIKKYKRQHLVMWGTRHQQESEKIKSLDPKNHIVFFSAERVYLTYLYFLLGMLPFMDIKEDSIQIPMFTDEFYEWKKSDAKNSTERFKVHAFFGLMKLLNMASKPLFAHLKKRGILCIYWVLNETKDFEKAIELGANGIMTDRPTLLKEYLDTKYKVA